MGVGRRLSDSSRVELEGVVGLGGCGGLGGGGGPAGQTGVLLPPVFGRAKASTKLRRKRVGGRNIWNVFSTKRNPEQM